MMLWTLEVYINYPNLADEKAEAKHRTLSGITQLAKVQSKISLCANSKHIKNYLQITFIYAHQ